MERLSGEARDRVRASSLSLVVALTLVAVVVGLYATLVGFTRTTVADSDVVAVSDDGRVVTVQLSHGGCQRPGEVEVLEGDDAVVLTAYVTERVPLTGQSCPSIREVSRQDVTLSEPVGDRELRTVQPQYDDGAPARTMRTGAPMSVDRQAWAAATSASSVVPAVSSCVGTMRTE